MTTLFKLADKVAAFKDKLKLWEQHVNKWVFDMFQTLAETLKDSKPEQAFSDLLSVFFYKSSCVFFYKSSSAIFQALKTLELQRNGSVIHLFSNQVNRPYLYDKKTNCWTLQNGSLKCIFHTTTLPTFWLKVLPEYPDLAIKALKTLLPFPTSYLCESGFSVMVAINTKPRNSLDVRATLRVQ